MSITNKRRFSGLADPVEPLMRSILNAVTGYESSLKTPDHRNLPLPSQTSTSGRREDYSRSTTRSGLSGDYGSSYAEDTDHEEPEFIFPSPTASASETTTEAEVVDPGPQMPIHDSTLLLDKMTDDRAAPPMRFCPADPPIGSRPYDPGALSSDQQRRLNHLKRATARDDQRYLSQHPEIGAVCALLLSSILREQPLNIREFCSNWVKRPELHQEVDQYLAQYPPPSRHDDVSEEYDWFPEPKEEEEVPPKAVFVPAEETLRRIEKQRRRSKSVYDHRATILHRDLLREGAEDMIRRWLDDMLTTALSHRTDFWESFERAQEFIWDERAPKKVKKVRTKEETERDAAELAEAEQAVEAALNAMRKKVEIIDVQKKAGAYVPPEVPGEDVGTPEDIAQDRRVVEAERVEAVAEALQRLRAISRGGPSYMAALSEAITRLQEHREGELEKPPTVSERALRWSAIVRGERASLVAYKQDMDDKALRLAAAVASTERKKSIERTASPRVPELEEEEDEDGTKAERRKKRERGRKKKMSAKELEEYNLRLSLVFPELADMLHDDEDNVTEIKEQPFQEQMAQATKDAIAIAMKRLRKPARRGAGARAGLPFGGGARGRAAPGAAPDAGYSTVSDDVVGPRAGATKFTERRRRKRLATAVVFEGLDPGQMKEKMKEKVPEWPPEGEFEAYPGGSLSESSEDEDEEEEKDEKEEADEEKIPGEEEDETGEMEKVAAEGEEEGDEREGSEGEEEFDEGTEYEAAPSEPDSEYQQVAAEDAGEDGTPRKRATDLLRDKLIDDEKKRSSAGVEEHEPQLDETENKFVGFEEPAKEDKAQDRRSVLSKKSIATTPQTPDTPTPGDESPTDAGDDN